MFGLKNIFFCLLSPAKEKSSMRPTATCEQVSSSRHIQDLSFYSWKPLLTMKRSGRLQITPAVKHWNCFSHNGTVPHTVTLSSSTSKSGRCLLGEDVLTTYKTPVKRELRELTELYGVRGKVVPFGFQALQTFDSTK